MHTRRTIAALVALAALPLAAQADIVYGLTAGNGLVSFDSANPASVTDYGALNGMRQGESLVGFDFRPRNGGLYAVSSQGRLYEVNVGTRQVSQVGGSTFNPPLRGTNFGVDFNPTVDRLRIVSDAGQNLRVNPNDGTVVGGMEDGALQYAAGDANQGATPRAVGSAYTNNRDGATTTTLYNIDSGLNVLVTQIPPNNGTLNTVGSLMLDVGDAAGFDIATSDGAAYAAFNLTGQGSSTFYRINLATGEAMAMGSIGFRGTLTDIAVQIPAPSAGLALAGLLGVAGVRRRR